jgi:cell division protein FtsN
MQVNLIILLGIALAAMFFGYFFGLFEGRGQGAKKQKAEDEAKVSIQTTLPPPSPPEAPKPPEVLVENRLLGISLDERYQPQLELDGQHVNAQQLTPDQRQRLIELMLILRPWVESNAGQKLSSAPQAAPRTMTGPLSSRLSQPAPQSEAKQPSHAPAVPSISAATPVPTAAPVLVVPVPEPQAPTSLVGQVNAILQSRLIGTPLEDMGIRLVESTNGGALVFVGDKTYEGVGDVTDPVVQGAIRAAIAEWEKRYTPGLK